MFLKCGNKIWPISDGVFFSWREEWLEKEDRPIAPAFYTQPGGWILWHNRIGLLYFISMHKVWVRHFFLWKLTGVPANMVIILASHKYPKAPFSLALGSASHEAHLILRTWQSEMPTYVCLRICQWHKFYYTIWKRCWGSRTWFPGPFTRQVIDHTRNEVIYRAY
jgi:hypothetical protein